MNKTIRRTKPKNKVIKTKEAIISKGAMRA
jgi:hypothetical protein